MPNAHPINALLLASAVLIGALLTGAISKRVPALQMNEGASVEDATGARIAVRDYVRVVSTSTIADQVLVQLIDPRRLLAVSGHTLRTQPSAIYGDKIGVERARDIETIIELRPDIVFINNFVDRRHVERFKDAGLNVFDLGPMRGLETLRPNIRQLAAVLGVESRAERLIEKLEMELAEVSTDVGSRERRRALYVGLHGDRLYGGTAGTSFHDVLVGAGLIDIAAEAGYKGWPAYSNEEILSLDPDWIVTNPQSEETLCGHPGFEALSACANGQVRSVATDLLTDPGLGIVDAARAVRNAVYGEAP